MQRVTDLRYKEVINLCNGACLGCVSDVEFDTTTACLVAIVIFGRLKFFGLFGREDDIIIPWGEIEVIGEDTILVRFKEHFRNPRVRKKGFFPGFSQ